MDVDPNFGEILMDMDPDSDDFDSASNHNSHLDDNLSDLSSDDDANFGDNDVDVPDLPEKEMIGDFLLYLRGCTRSTNDDVLEHLAQLQKVVIFYARLIINKADGMLQEARGVSLIESIDVQELIESINCSQGLHSIYTQNKYFKEKFNVVTPRRIEIGAKFVPSGTSTVDGNQPIKKKKDEFIHIPICEVLPRWLENGSYGNILNPPREEKDGILESYLDGSHFKTHPYKQRKPNSKFIKLYYDEVELCDPAGSKSSSINKLGMFYWTDEDISPMYSSQLKFINLTGIIPNPHVNKYGINTILQHIVDDFKRLENGIDLPNGEKLYGCISTVIADNLGAHQLGGYRESFSAIHPCRVCNASKEQTRTMTKEDPLLLRTPEEHDRQVLQIESATGNAKEEYKMSYGINKRSVLNELEGFHVTTSIPLDLTHDDLEGICKRTTRLFLKEICFEQKLMSLDQLNNRIENFDYGYSEKSSKPSPITKKMIMDKSVGFKQSASQMAQLVTMLPLIVTHFVLEECPLLENYIKMLEIMAICNADKMDVSFLSYLAYTISEYLEGFQILYKTHLIPKQHYLVHRPGLIMKFGPLGNFKTIRYEAKHQYFKRLGQGWRTYKHLSLSLARKHQLNQCHIQRQNLERSVTTGPLKWSPIDLLPFKDLFPDVQRLQTTPWVEINGKKYVSKKCILAVGYSEDNLPEFVALHTIIWRNDSPNFVCLKVKTVEHNMFLMAYEIEIEEEYMILTINNLLSPEVLHTHRWRNRLIVTIKKALGRLH